MRTLATTVFLAFALGASAPALGDAVRTVDVHFPAGASGETVSGSVRGYDTVRYRIDARAGQTLSARLSASNLSLYMNVIAPGAKSAMYMGATSGHDFSGVLPVDGVYVVEVYLYRNAARRREKADFTLDLRVDGSGARAPAAPGRQAAADVADGCAGGPDYFRVEGLAAGDALNLRAGPSPSATASLQLGEGAIVRNLGCRTVHGATWRQIQLTGDSDEKGWVDARFLREAAAPAPHDARVAGTPYHATAEIGCGFKGDAAVSVCKAGVSRKDAGVATLVVTFPDGFRRTLDFDHGHVVARGGAAQSRREGDDTVVTVDDGAERFVVPDALIKGD
ncbi:hypothetical protein [Methylocella sp.]|uniref:hypothetical protein n=1 Tax=Methylocella sp. TaxID=1978226 RepID=UPI003782E155